MFGRKHASPENVEKTVHLASDALVKKPHRMMQPGREFDRHAVPHRRHERTRDLRASRKSIRRHAASAKLEPGAAPRKLLDRRGGVIGRRFPKDIQGQIAERGAGRA